MSTTPKSGSNWCQRLQNLYNIWRQRLHNLNQNDVNGSKIGIKLASTAPKSVPNWCQRLQIFTKLRVDIAKEKVIYIPVYYLITVKKRKQKFILIWCVTSECLVCEHSHNNKSKKHVNDGRNSIIASR